MERRWNVRMGSKMTGASFGGKGGAIAMLACASVLWSIGGLLIKLVDANPMTIAGVRGLIAAAVLCLSVGKPRFTWSLPQIGAALCYTAMVFLFVASTKLTTAANAILLQFTAPIYVALLGAWFLKEKAKPSDWLTIALVLGGMGLFFVDDIDTRSVVGNLMAVACGLFYAFFTMFMRMQKEGSPVESVLLGNLFAAVIGLPFLSVSMPDASGWLGLLLLGVFQLGISYVLYSRAIKHVTALEAIFISVIEPILNPVWVFLRLGEVPGPMAIVGGVIVLAAITMRCIAAARSAEASPTDSQHAA